MPLTHSNIEFHHGEKYWCVNFYLQFCLRTFYSSLRNCPAWEAFVSRKAWKLISYWSARVYAGEGVANPWKEVLFTRIAGKRFTVKHSFILEIPGLLVYFYFHSRWTDCVLQLGRRWVPVYWKRRLSIRRVPLDEKSNTVCSRLTVILRLQVSMHSSILDFDSHYRFLSSIFESSRFALSCH